MHILEIPSFFPPHGGLFCVEQAKALKARGHEVRILSCVQLGCSVDGEFFFTAPYKRRWNEIEGIEVYSSYMRGFPKAVRPNVMRWLNIVEGMFSEYVSKYGEPDIIHAHCCKLAGMAAYRISRRTGIPYFITEHIPLGQYIDDFGKGWTRHTWLRLVMKEAFEHAACVLPVSRELVDDISPFFGQAYRCSPLSNIIDTDFFAYRKRELLEGRPFRFCCFAVADIYRKGFDVLSEAWRLLQTQEPAKGSNIELHIAGNGTEGASVRKLFDGYNNVTFHGNLDKAQVREVLYESDALVLASRSEVQPLVILEAMATGIPVIATECVPKSERIENACFIVPVGDAMALHSMMERVRSIPSPTSLLSEQVRRLASPEIVSEQLEKIFMQ